MKIIPLHRVFFSLAILFMYIMALLSSLDSSFVFIFLGLALAFFFVGYRAIPQSQHDDSTRWSFSNVFSDKQTHTHQHYNQNQNNKLVAIIAASLIITIFVIIFYAIAFSGSDNFSDEEFLSQQAESFRMNGEYDSAIASYQKILIINPTNADAVNALGYIELQKENYDGALLKFNDALQIDPEHNDALYNKSVVYYNKRDYVQALNYSLKLLEINPEYTNAMLVAGDSYYEQQNYDAAIHLYEDAYDAGIRSANLSHLMAYIYDLKGRQEDAITFYQEAINYDSTKVEIYERLGELMPGTDGNVYRELANQYNQ